MNKRPIVISLCSGAGGLDLGFEQAGFDVPVGVEIDPIHADTHRFNFPQWTTLTASITTLSADVIRQHVGDRTIDVLIGGLPCQSFSIQGKRDPNDPRALLLQDFVRLVHQLQPNYFVLENVKGLIQGRCCTVLTQLVRQLTKLGYHIPKRRILNAKDYGVPQHRERLFVLGSRAGLPPLRYPEPSGTVTVAEALADIPDADDGYWFAGSGCVQNFSVIANRSGYAKAMQCLDPDCWKQGYERDWDSSVLYNSHRTQHSAQTRARFASIALGKRDPVSHFHKLDPDSISPTLRAGTDSSRGRHTAPRPIHYKYNRCITVREMARLSGFPDWFRFDDRKWHGGRQVGNAVPPPLAWAVACEVMRAIDESRAAIVPEPAGHGKDYSRIQGSLW